jgi:hypothetical protein
LKSIRDEKGVTNRGGKERREEAKKGVKREKWIIVLE